MVPGPAAVRHGAARRVRPGLRTHGAVHHGSLQHPRRQRVPSNSEERRVLVHQWHPSDSSALSTVFGRDGAAAHEAIEGLSELYRETGNIPPVANSHAAWADYRSSGDSSSDTFVRHTYLSLLCRLAAYRFLEPLPSERASVAGHQRRLLRGRRPGQLPGRGLLLVAILPPVDGHRRGPGSAGSRGENDDCPAALRLQQPVIGPAGGNMPGIPERIRASEQPRRLKRRWRPCRRSQRGPALLPTAARVLHWPGQCRSPSAAGWMAGRTRWTRCWERRDNSSG